MQAGKVGAVAAGLFTVVATLAACQPGLHVQTWQPPALDAGGAREIRVTSGFGRRTAVAAVQDAAFDSIRDGGFYRAVDLTRSELTLDRQGAFIDDEALDHADGALYLRLDVPEYFVEVSQEARDGTDDAGNAIVALVDVTHAHAVIDATLVRGDGTVLKDAVEAEGIHDEDGIVDGDAALATAARNAIDTLLADVTPQDDSVFVPFDDRDSAEKPILDNAQQHAVFAAIDAEATFIAANPDKAAPHYNRAVMMAASHDLAAALVELDLATGLHPDDKLRDLVDSARVDFANHLATAQRLGLVQ